MPRATAAAAAETARRILTVATDLFAERGYADVSLDDVATAADVTRGAVYHHYGSKKGLFRAVTSTLQEQVAATLAAAADDAAPDPAAQLRAGSHAFLDAITAPRTVRVLLVDAPAVVGWQQWRTDDARNSARHLAEALAAAGVPAPLQDALTAQLSGAMNEAALWLAERRDDPVAREAAHTALDVLLDAVPGASPPAG